MKKLYISLILVFISAATILWLSLRARNTHAPQEYKMISRRAGIKPDYSDVVIPPNIAPLNFMVLESGKAYIVKIYSSEGESIVLFSKTGKIIIPKRRWKSLLTKNKGRKLYFDLYINSADKQWSRYETIANTIANEGIDGHIVYRLIKPIFSRWHDVGVYQRNLANYDESVVFHGKPFSNACVNCHTFLNNSGDTMFIGVRSATYGSSAIMVRNNHVQKIGTKFGYTAWHPSGRLAAYSINKVHQFFHAIGTEVRDVFDLDSALCYYMIDSQVTRTNPEIANKNRLETYPAWSPDGKFLYFCSAPIWADYLSSGDYDELKYDLMRISYNVETDQWGKLETVLSAEDTGLSILLPRVSPDGRFLLFCMCKYGCFPVDQPSSDLYLTDLQTGKYEKLDINSEYSESWHSFSSNGRWIAFSSKRRGGMFTRTFFSYIDENGKVYKPFILPQKDPVFYDSFLKTYSVPELITTPVKVSSKILGRVTRSTDKIDVDLPITGATPMVESTEPWQERE